MTRTRHKEGVVPEGTRDLNGMPSRHYRAGLSYHVPSALGSFKRISPRAPERSRRAPRNRWEFLTRILVGSLA